MLSVMQHSGLCKQNSCKACGPIAMYSLPAQQVQRTCLLRLGSVIKCRMQVLAC